MRVSALVSATTSTLLGRVNDESRRAGSARFRTRGRRCGRLARPRNVSEEKSARAMAVPCDCACLQRPVGQIEKHQHLLIIM